LFLLHGYVENFAVRHKFAPLVVPPFEVQIFAYALDVACGFKCEGNVVDNAVTLDNRARILDLIFLHGCGIIPLRGA
jgi:hypothetical protein